jgi:hypothetical protein
MANFERLLNAAILAAANSQPQHPSDATLLQKFTQHFSDDLFPGPATEPTFNAGVYQDADDFINDNGNSTFKLNWTTGGTTGAPIGQAQTGCDAVNLGSGVVSLGGGVAPNDFRYLALHKFNDSSHSPFISVGGGILDLRWRVWVGVQEGSSGFGIKTVGVGTTAPGSTAIQKNGLGLFFLCAIGPGDGPNWYYCCAKGGAPTFVNTITPVTTGQWQELRILTNADWSSVNFYINGVAVGNCVNTAPNFPPESALISPFISSEYNTEVPDVFNADYCWFSWRPNRSLPQ